MAFIGLPCLEGYKKEKSENIITKSPTYFDAPGGASDSSWIIANGGSENKQEIAVSYSKTDTNGNASESVGGIRLTGTAKDANTYSFGKDLTKTVTYQNGEKTVIGSGTETNTQAKNHSFVGNTQTYADRLAT
ncbi:hypothetical protein FACS1894170_04600 [Planctomycetales bacterium]|nr:hypothetical protein FACS1894170_04600 [Planctomycetales bacterium]